MSSVEKFPFSFLVVKTWKSIFRRASSCRHRKFCAQLVHRIKETKHCVHATRPSWRKCSTAEYVRLPSAVSARGTTGSLLTEPQTLLLRRFGSGCNGKTTPRRSTRSLCALTRRRSWRRTNPSCRSIFHVQHTKQLSRPTGTVRLVNLPPLFTPHDDFTGGKMFRQRERNKGRRKVWAREGSEKISWARHAQPRFPRVPGDTTRLPPILTLVVVTCSLTTSSGKCLIPPTTFRLFLPL